MNPEYATWKAIGIKKVYIATHIMQFTSGT